jgi:parallel beta-helix repeat protein
MNCTGTGIKLSDADQCELLSNTVSFSRETGILIAGESDSNIIENNTVNDNGFDDVDSDIEVRYGIWIADFSEYNVVRFNDLIDNWINARCDMESNTFDYNFYSDYNGTDLDYDGIGDVPHNITGLVTLSDPHPQVFHVEPTTTYQTANETSTRNTTTETSTGPTYWARLLDFGIIIPSLSLIFIITIVIIILRRNARRKNWIMTGKLIAQYQWLLN